MNVQEITEIVLGPALFTSAILGLIIGAFYGYEISGAERRASFPTMLWTIGQAWLVSTAILGALREAPFDLEPAIGRGILWTFLCLAIPSGLQARASLARWRIRRRRRAIEE